MTRTNVGKYYVRVQHCQETGSYGYTVEREDGSVLTEDKGYHSEQAAFVFGGMAAAFVSIGMEQFKE